MKSEIPHRLNKRKHTPYRSEETKPIDWYADKNTAVRSETSLWVAVITQAMMDALSQSRKPEEQFQKFEAIRWLSNNSQDFREVCQLADLDPDYVRQKAKKALLTGGVWRAKAGTGKRYAERKAYRERTRLQKAPPLPFATFVTENATA